jgi:riboflavin synthase
MFTGLIEAVGEIIEVKPLSTGFRLRVGSEMANEMMAGDSLAVSGVCLTVIMAGAGEVHTDIGPETARVTTLGGVKRGTLVNLERPMRADARFGGHFVQGHVDAMGTVEEIRPEADFYWLTISFPSLLNPYIIHRGSIAVDGVSLTVAGLGDERLDVQIIPYTWSHTSYRGLRERDRVNIECDMIGKYVVRAAELAGYGQAQKVRPVQH